MVVEQTLDLCRVDILAPPDDHVFGTAQDPQTALVELDDVLGGGPAAFIKHRCGEFFISKITRRRMGAPEPEHAGFTFGYLLAGIFVQEPHLVAGQHTADSSSAKIFRIFHTASGHRPFILGPQIAGDACLKNAFSLFGHLG